MNLALLLDENVSPFLTRNLAEMGVFAQGVVHIGLSGAPDHAVWEYALGHDLTMVTTNADDFLELADETELHSG